MIGVGDNEDFIPPGPNHEFRMREVSADFEEALT
jgi:hypothetical protein